MGERGQKEAWVTLATNDSYALGCLVLGNSLRRVQTTRKLVLMYTEGLSDSMKYQLETVFDHLVEVSVLDSKDARNLSLLGRPDLNVTFTKVHCWELVQYEKGVFLDADTLILQNCDELFDREELSAAPDAGWPDCFNSGVFVFKPSLETYQQIIDFAQTSGSFDGGDQGLLNSFFNTWPTKDIHKHLPFIYNVVSQAFYSYLPAFTQFRQNIKIVHFIGAIKPWHHPYNTANKTVTTFPETGHSQEFLQYWWDLFMELVQPRLDPTLTPFIHFEYVLPSSPPPCHPPAHGMEESHDQGDRPTSYQVLYPYVPPALDHHLGSAPRPPPAVGEECCPSLEQGSPPSHFSPPPPECPLEDRNPSPPPVHFSQPEVQDCLVDCSQEQWQDEHVNDDSERWPEKDEPQVVDMPIVVRDFHPYETYYAEEPFLLINPDSPPPTIYESSAFAQSLHEETDRITLDQAEEQLVLFVEDDHVIDPKDQLSAAAETVGMDASKCEEVGSVDSAGDSKDKVDDEKQDINSNEIKQIGEVGGLVGELAQMKVSGAGECADYIILDDRERRLAWERGHADYLGADSFANIMKKLDEKMAPLPATKEGSRKSEASQSEASLTKGQERSVDSGGKKSSKTRSQSVGLPSSREDKAGHSQKATEEEKEEKEESEDRSEDRSEERSAESVKEEVDKRKTEEVQ